MGTDSGDYGNDRDLGVFVMNFNQCSGLLENTVGNRNNWIQIQVVGEKVVPIR